MTNNDNDRARCLRRLLVGAIVGAGVVLGLGQPASAATAATFSNGTLSVFGDNANNSIAISRNAAGNILVNGGAVAVTGGSPTVANTALVQVFGVGGNDTITLNEASGALPRLNLFGGVGEDTLTGGSGGDMLFGQAGNDTLLGRGGNDFVFGGTENDTLAGGDVDDQVFGESGNDRMIWSPGDDTDLNEGGAGVDTVEVNGGNGAEVFTATANGVRVRFDRTTPAPFALDVGTSEKLVLNANGGDDRFSTTGNLAALIALTVDGGAGNDTILGSNGVDVLLGGDGADFVDGQQGNDVALLGAGDDRFQWDPGDGNDVVEGQIGLDKLLVNGSGASERFGASPNGGRLRFTRDIAAIVLDVDDVEGLDLRALGGADTLTVDDLAGTDVAAVDANLSPLGGAGGDGQPDTVVVNATSADDVVELAGTGSSVSVVGLTARVNVLNGELANDRVVLNTLAGDDVVDGSDLAAGTLRFTADGGDGDDVLLGGAGDDVLLGGAGNDVLVGGPGNDTLDGAAGDNVVINLAGGFTTSATDTDRVASATTATARVVDARVVVEDAGGQRPIPESLSRRIQDALASS